MNDNLKNQGLDVALCETCSTPLPKSGYFCGKCLTQFKCKTCESLLEKDFAGCVMCGTPKSTNNSIPTSNNLIGSNSFRLYETKEARTIEASFSDVIGKDIASILRDAATNGRANPTLAAFKTSNSNTTAPITEDIEVQVVGSPSNESMGPVQKLTESSPVEYPTLRAVGMKKLAGSEPEWVIVYSFYASNFGKDTFTRQQIVEKYKESGRTCDSTRLSQNLTRTVQSGYLNPLTDKFSILDLGIKKAIEIVNRTTSSAPRSKTNGKKVSKEETKEVKEATNKKPENKPKGLKKLNNINFEPEGKESLNAFYVRYQLKSDQERNLLFVYYLNQILEITEVTFDHIYTCYDILDLKVSENLPQTVRNTGSRTGWIEVKDSTVSITIRGSNQIKDWNKQLYK